MTPRNRERIEKVPANTSSAFQTVIANTRVSLGGNDPSTRSTPVPMARHSVPSKR